MGGSNSFGERQRARRGFREAASRLGGSGQTGLTQWILKGRSIIVINVRIISLMIMIAIIIIIAIIAIIILTSFLFLRLLLLLLLLVFAVF